MSYYFAGRYYNKYKSFFPYKYKDYSFKIDLENGDLYFSRKLIVFSGRHLPLDLSLKYVQYNRAFDVYFENKRNWFWEFFRRKNTK